mgnify:CR=1 FL=1
MEETIVRFGKHGDVVGILSEGPRGKSNTLLILLNTASEHCTGVGRLYVKIARSLSDVLPVLRFDYSGNGDSPPRHGAKSFLDSALENTQEALDFCEKYFGGMKVLLAGVCFGGDTAYAAALKDERVIGIAMMNSYFFNYGIFPDLDNETYKTFKQRTYDGTHNLLGVYLKKIFSKEDWKRLISRQSAFSFGRLLRTITHYGRKKIFEGETVNIIEKYSNYFWKNLLDAGRHSILFYAENDDSYSFYKASIGKYRKSQSIKEGNSRTEVVQDEHSNWFLSQNSQEKLLKKIRTWVQERINSEIINEAEHD